MPTNDPPEVPEPLQPVEHEEPGQSGQVDLAELMGQVAQMQQGLAEVQAQAAAQEVAGVSGGGVVRVTVTGAMEFTSVRIDPAAVDSQDVTLLEDLVLAAVHDAVDKVRDLNRQALGPLGLDGPDSPFGL